ncbi:MAG: ATP-binding protein [Alphaproteobacteria bacterium]|nr:ATP-binding protein [Alphaproteobacteria bacterium]
MGPVAPLSAAITWPRISPLKAASCVLTGLALGSSASGSKRRSVRSTASRSAMSEPRCLRAASIWPWRLACFSRRPATVLGRSMPGAWPRQPRASWCVCYLMPEFSRQVLDSLRQPLETGEIVVARAAAHVRYPSRFQLVAAMNPCRCGYLGDPERACTRAPRCGADYQSRISGPLYDRIDLTIEVPSVSAQDLTLPAPREGTAEVAARVAGARARQSAREGETGARTNAELEGERLDAVATPDGPGRALLVEAADRMKLSARAYTRVLKVARTVADLEDSAEVRRAHIAEALAFRRPAALN